MCSETLDAVAEQKKKREEVFASIPEKMRCSISRDLLRDPYTVPCCKSNFCAKCILPDSVSDAIQCPNCYKTVAGDKIVQNVPLAQEIEKWRVETHFEMDEGSGAQDAAGTLASTSTTSDSSTIIPMISTSSSMESAKVERRKPPPRRGAATTAGTILSPSVSSSTTSDDVPISPKTTSSPYLPNQPKEVLSVSHITDRDQNVVSTSTSSTAPQLTQTDQNLPSTSNTQDIQDIQFRLDRIKASRATTSTGASNGSTQHSNSSSDVIPATISDKDATLSSSTSSASGESTIKREKSPQTRLREIAALREARRQTGTSTFSSNTSTSTEDKNIPKISSNERRRDEAAMESRDKKDSDFEDSPVSRSRDTGEMSRMYVDNYDDNDEDGYGRKGGGRVDPGRHGSSSSYRDGKGSSSSHSSGSHSKRRSDSDRRPRSPPRRDDRRSDHRRDDFDEDDIRRRGDDRRGDTRGDYEEGDRKRGHSTDERRNDERPSRDDKSPSRQTDSYRDSRGSRDERSHVRHRDSKSYQERQHSASERVGPGSPDRRERDDHLSKQRKMDDRREGGHGNGRGSKHYQGVSRKRGRGEFTSSERLSGAEREDYDYIRSGPSKSRKESDVDSVHDHRD